MAKLPSNTIQKAPNVAMWSNCNMIDVWTPSRNSYLCTLLNGNTKNSHVERKPNFSYEFFVLGD